MEQSAHVLVTVNRVHVVGLILCDLRHALAIPDKLHRTSDYRFTRLTGEHGFTDELYDGTIIVFPDDPDVFTFTFEIPSFRWPIEGDTVSIEAEVERVADWLPKSLWIW